MNNVVAVMKLDRLTKGAALYKNVKEGTDEAVTNIYLRKSGLPSDVPQEITITIKAS